MLFQLTLLCIISNSSSQREAGATSAGESLMSKQSSLLLHSNHFHNNNNNCHESARPITAPATCTDVNSAPSSVGNVNSRTCSWYGQRAAAVVGALTARPLTQRSTSELKAHPTTIESLRSTHSGRTALAKRRLIRMLIVIVVIFFSVSGVAGLFVNHLFQCLTPSYIYWLMLNAQDAFGVCLYFTLSLLYTTSIALDFQRVVSRSQYHYNNSHISGQLHQPHHLRLPSFQVSQRAICNFRLQSTFRPARSLPTCLRAWQQHWRRREDCG